MKISYIQPAGDLGRDPDLWHEALTEMMPGVSAVRVDYAGRDKVRITFEGTQASLDTFALECPGIRVTVDGKRRVLGGK
jgi:hypothetical protein